MPRQPRPDEPAPPLTGIRRGVGSDGGNDPNGSKDPKGPDNEPKPPIVPIIPPLGDEGIQKPALDLPANPILPPPGQERQSGTNANGDAIFIDSFGNTYIRDARGNKIPTDAAGRPMPGALDPANAQSIAPHGIPIKAADLSAKFEPLGVSNVRVDDTIVGKQMIGAIRAGSPGLSEEDAIRFAQDYVKTGVAVPVSTPIKAGAPLIKIVPAGETPSTTTGYFVTQAEYAALSRNPAELAGRLGLPLGSHAANHDVFQIIARSDTTVFTSTIAPTVQGSVRQSGGAVPSRRPCGSDQLQDNEIT